MKSYDLLSLAYRNLWRRKGRTILTVLGVIIGTTAIVVMLSLGIGLVDSQKKQMEQWGSLNIIRVQQSYSFPGEPSEEQQRQLTDEAIEEIKEMEGVLAVSPAYEVGGEAALGKKVGYFQLVGIEPAMMELLEFKVGHGRLLAADDKFNVVAGSWVINNFQDPKMAAGRWEEPPEADPLELLHQRISLTLLNSRQQKRIYNLNVVGILNDDSMENAYSVFGPITEIKKMRDFVEQGSQDAPIYPPEKDVGVPLQPRTNRQAVVDQYSFALVRTTDVALTRNLSQELRDRGFNAYSMADSLEGIEDVARQMQAVLGGIGAITLLVAAIGITNTMVMSIYERTREIAIMKVVGASFADVRTLFLTESSLIGIIGGTIGIGFSYFISYLLNTYIGAAMGSGMGMENTPMQVSLIPPWLVLFAVAFSMGIGLISGLYPANRAIHLDPITAMRHG
ncbi:MAG TPA: ABC transporter permease [Oscillospiraceae bacterium]|nr:ABC transporter permease [Oscillospiraceae bacterium]